jgi:hypothetical protein
MCCIAKYVEVSMARALLLFSLLLSMSHSAFAERKYIECKYSQTMSIKDISGKEVSGARGNGMDQPSESNSQPLHFWIDDEKQLISETKSSDAGRVMSNIVFSAAEIRAQLDDFSYVFDRVSGDFSYQSATTLPNATIRVDGRGHCAAASPPKRAPYWIDSITGEDTERSTSAEMRFRTAQEYCRNMATKKSAPENQREYYLACIRQQGFRFIDN